MESYVHILVVGLEYEVACNIYSYAIVTPLISGQIMPTYKDLCIDASFVCMKAIAAN